jgi:transposase
MHHCSECYIGIDVSKLWFDLSMMKVTDHQKQPMLTHRFDNTAEGLKQMSKWLKAHKVDLDQNILVVIENTGVYHRLIWTFCSEHRLPIHIGNATHIKHSFGITRGKNDRIDSQRLCSYAQKHSDELKATPGLDPVLMELKDLFSARARLLSQLGSIKVYLGELKGVNDKGVQHTLEQAHQTAMEGIAKSIELIEGHIMSIIGGHSAMKANYDLLVSVPGIGHLTAVYLICCTANFSGNPSGKQLASYGGVVPYGNSSGTSIKGRPRVHHMANKELKKMLHLCALSAVRVYPEFKTYYERKKKEGKHPMSILNAVRNKIALRAVAVIKKRQPYVDNLEKAA